MSKSFRFYIFLNFVDKKYLNFVEVSLKFRHLTQRGTEFYVDSDFRPIQFMPDKPVILAFLGGYNGILGGYSIPNFGYDRVTAA